MTNASEYRAQRDAANDMVFHASKAVLKLARENRALNQRIEDAEESANQQAGTILALQNDLRIARQQWDNYKDAARRLGKQLITARCDAVFLRGQLATYEGRDWQWGEVV